MRSRIVHRANHPRRFVGRARNIQRVRRVVTRRTIYPGQPTVISQPGAPIAIPRPAPQGEYGGGGSGGYPIIIGGSGGFGGGGGFFGGFFGGGGGSSGGGGSIV
ncbi:MAG: hypothetical protein ABL909_07475, partial [Sphingopyxis sp.]